VIRAHAVTVRAGRRLLLDTVDLDAPTGSVTGIVGPNGSGKTTLIRALLRAVPIQEGRVEIDGQDVRHRSRRWIAQRVASVAQRLDPDPALTVADEVALGGLAQVGPGRGDGVDPDERVAAALDAVALTHRAGDSLAALSGGELQRVGLARAIAHGADHVLLDEPTNHLDLRYQIETLDLVRDLVEETGVAVGIVLHDLDHAARVADHLILMDHGRIRASGAPADVLTAEHLREVYGIPVEVDVDELTGRVRVDPISRHAPRSPSAGSPAGIPHVSFTPATPSERNPA